MDLTNLERTALAILRSGGSWDDAMQQTRLSFERLQELWTLAEEQKNSARKSPRR